MVYLEIKKTNYCLLSRRQQRLIIIKENRKLKEKREGREEVVRRKYLQNRLLPLYCDFNGWF